LRARGQLARASKTAIVSLPAHDLAARWASRAWATGCAAGVALFQQVTVIFVQRSKNP
jgi:hypothetical protein